VFGQVKLRGISDRHLVPVDVVKIRVRLTTGKGFVNITCAVVEKLNYPLILGSDIVDKLNKQLIDESFVATEMMNVVHENDDDDVGDDDDDDKNEVTNDKCDKHESENVNMSDPRKASAEILRRDQRSDRSLIHCWSLADRQKAGYYVRDGVLYRNYKYLGQDYEQLVLPVNRHPEVMKLAHEIYAGHLGAKKTKERIKLTFTWPTIVSDVQKTCESCHQCQKKRRVTVYDRVPVMPIPRGDVPFDLLVMGTVQFQRPELLPRQRVDVTTLPCLSVEQRTKLLALLDKYSECYSEKPGFFTVDQYKFDNFADGKPPRLKINYMLEDLKPLIEARLHELFRLSSVYLRVIKWGPQ